MNKTKHSAFTMIELVMVIVVLGILAALALPRMERDIRQEAGDNLLTAIRYTQHLALMDDKTDPMNVTWQRKLWQIRFSNPGGEWLYSIGSNLDGNNNIDQNESAIDPANGKYMHSGNASPADNDESPDIFLTKKYGINGISINNCTGTSASNAMHIAFDNLGRPHRGVTQGGANDYRTLINNSNCLITLSFESNDNNLSIVIEQETGYAYISDQNAS